MPIKKISLYVTLGALFLIPLFPLIVVNSYFFPFITGKAFYFRVLVEVAFSAWLILAFIDPRYRPKVTLLSLAVTLFAVVALIADLLGVNPIRSLWSNFERMEGWITIAHLWAFYLVTTSVFSPRDIGKASSTKSSNSAVAEQGSRMMWHRWFNVSLLVALIAALYGLAQFFGWTPTHQGAGRVDASLGNSAYMAVYMLLNGFIAAYLFFAARSGKIVNGKTWQWVYGVLTLLFGFIIFLTQTRGTILGLIGGVMLSLAIYAVFGRSEPKKNRLISGGVILLVILSMGAFWVNRHNPIIERSPIFGRFSNIGWNEASNQARQLIWPMALNGVMQRPVFGWGQENFNYIFNADYNPAMYAQEQWFDRAHNVFIDWMVASGFVGFLFYISLYGIFLFAVWKSSLSMAEKSVLTGLLAGYFVHNIFVFDNLASYVLFFSALGFANSLSKRGKTAALFSSVQWFGDRPTRMDAVEYIVAPVVIALFVFVLYFFDVRAISANTRLIAALTSCTGQGVSVEPFQRALAVNIYVANQEIREQLLNCSASVLNSQQVPGPTKQAFISLAQSAIDAQVAATPKDARIYVLGGAFFDGIGQYEEAAKLLEKGHELSPNKQTLDFELATAYINTNRTEQAVALLKKAYESAPDFFQAKNAYAISLVIAGKEAESRALFNNDPAIFMSQQMANVLASKKEYAKAAAIYANLASSSPQDVNINAQLAQLQYLAGMISASLGTLRKLEASHPELKDQIEAAIKQVESGK